MNKGPTPTAAEARRILEENERRSREVDSDRYASWQPAEIFMREGRRRTAWRMLHRYGVFPRAGDRVLEVGYGSLGWLADLMGLGLRCFDLHGIELDSGRAEVATQGHGRLAAHRRRGRDDVVGQREGALLRRGLLTLPEARRQPPGPCPAPPPWRSAAPARSRCSRRRRPQRHCPSWPR